MHNMMVINKYSYTYIAQNLVTTIQGALHVHIVDININNYLNM